MIYNSRSPFNIFFIPYVSAVPPPATAIVTQRYAILKSLNQQEINTVGERKVIWDSVPTLDQLNTLTISPTGEIDLGLIGFYEITLQGTIVYDAGSLNFEVALKHGVNIIASDKENQSDYNYTLTSVEAPIEDPIDTLSYNGPTYARINLVGVVDATSVQEISVVTTKILGAGASSNAIIQDDGFNLIIKRIPLL